MKTSLSILFLCLLLASTVRAQVRLSWTQLSIKDAEKILNDSAWGKTQTETDTTEMFFTPTRSGTSSIGQPSASRTNPSSQQQINNQRADQGATNQAISVNYRVRFFSAKPVREAIARLAMPEDPQQAKGYIDVMQPFVDRDFGQFIVLTVTFDSTDGRYSGPALQAFASATVETLKNKTYLERKDGKRMYLFDYRVPQNDGLGAKFVFLRAFESGPFLSDGSGSVRFYSEVGDKIKLNVTYKISELVYNGKLEY